jgi:hypothetical protein
MWGTYSTGTVVDLQQSLADRMHGIEILIVVTDWNAAASLRRVAVDARPRWRFLLALHLDKTIRTGTQ